MPRHLSQSACLPPLRPTNAPHAAMHFVHALTAARGPNARGNHWGWDRGANAEAKGATDVGHGTLNHTAMSVDPNATTSGTQSPSISPMPVRRGRLAAPSKTVG